MARQIALPRPPEAVSAATSRYWPLVVLALAGVALIVAEFLTYREIVAVTVVPEGGRTTGGSHHGYALALIGLVSLPMSYGAVIGGSRPAAAALTALGGLALAIVAIVDLPSLNDTGLIGRTYDLAEASPAIGFWLELVAAVVLLAGGLLLLRRSTVAARRAERGPAQRTARPARRRDGGPAASGYGTLRTSFPRTWPASRRSCASAARSSGKTSSSAASAAPSCTSGVMCSPRS